MTQQSGYAQDGEHGRRAPRLAALVALSTAGGLAAALLTGRGLRLLRSLPDSHVEVYLEILVLAVGATLAAWVATTSALALACVIVRSVGRRWDAGERLVLRHAPAAVRRLAGIGVSLSVGVGLALGAGSAQAAEPPAAPETSAPGPAVVDLGWQPTARTDSPVGDEAHQPAVGSTDGLPGDAAQVAPTPSSSPPPSAGGQPYAHADGSSPEPGPSGPALVPPGSASRSAAPTSESSAEPTTPHAAAQSPHAPTVMDTSPAGESDVAATGSPQPPHVPLGPLLGSPARTAAPSSTMTSDPAAPAPSVVEIVVLRGDTLWSIASRSLGPNASDASVATECQQWFDANRDVIGDDPDLIKPGQILSAPRSP